MRRLLGLVLFLSVVASGCKKVQQAITINLDNLTDTSIDSNSFTARNIRTKGEIVGECMDLLMGMLTMRYPDGTNLTFRKSTTAAISKNTPAVTVYGVANATTAFSGATGWAGGAQVIAKEQAIIKQFVLEPSANNSSVITYRVYISSDTPALPENMTTANNTAKFTVIGLPPDNQNPPTVAIPAGTDPQAARYSCTARAGKRTEVSTVLNARTT